MKFKKEKSGKGRKEEKWDSHIPDRAGPVDHQRTEDGITSQVDARADTHALAVLVDWYVDW